MDNGSQTSSVSNRWENASFTSSASMSTILQPLHPVVYNAWDPFGNRHRVSRVQNLETKETQLSSSDNRSDFIRPVESQVNDCNEQSRKSSQRNPWETVKRKSSDDLIDL